MKEVQNSEENTARLAKAVRYDLECARALFQVVLEHSDIFNAVVTEIQKWADKIEETKAIVNGHMEAAAEDKPGAE